MLKKQCKNIKVLVIFIITLQMYACEVVPPKSPITIDHIAEAISEDTDTMIGEGDEPPPDVTAALLPSLSIEVPSFSGIENDLEQRFDVATANVPALEFFMSLAEGTKYSMVVHPDTRGELTLNLKNVTIMETLEIVLEVYGYDYKLSNNTIMVFPRELQTRIYPVNYLNVKRVGSSEMRVTSGQFAAGGSSENGESNANGVTGTVINTSSETDFWQDLEEAINGLIGTEEGKKVVVNSITGLVVVKALPDDLRSVGEFLEKIQSIVARQVILEAKILEVELNDGYQSGINWSVLGDPEKGGSIVAGQIGGGSILSNSITSNFRPSAISGNTGELDPSKFDDVDGTNVNAFGGMFSLALNLNDFNAFIELIETQGNVQVLSSPRVSTVNNQKAIIKIGSDEYFITNVENTTTTTSVTSQNTPTIALTPFFSGIALDVTPQIAENNDVTLHIHPSVTQVEEKAKVFEIGGSNFNLPLAFSSTRESDSIVHAKNGQIVVIGGMISETMRENIASVPILGDIPFFGALFRHTSQVSIKSELIILLRAIVIETGQEWVNARQASADRFSELNRGFHSGGKIEIFGTLGEERTD